MSVMNKGMASLKGMKNMGDCGNASKMLVMTHGRKHNPGMEPVQSKKITPSDNSSPAKSY